MLEGTSAVARQQEEKRNSGIGYEVDRQQDDEFSNLAERERCIYRGPHGLAESTNGIVQRIFSDRSVLANKVLIASVDQDCIEYIDLRLILYSYQHLPKHAVRRRLVIMAHTTRNDSKSIATTAAPSPRTRNVPFTQALPFL